MKFVIISVGNELLNGDTVNTNASYIARKLVEIGHEIRRIIVVPDEVSEIAEEVDRASKLYDFVLITGGLGVTHDDVTNEAIAKALKRELLINEKVYKHLRNLSDREEAIKKLSSIPEGSEVIWNDVGAAPAYIVENIAVMPGVPAEMENTFSKILEKFEKLSYFEDQVRIDGYEVGILNELNSVVSEFPDVQIGSYPKYGYVVVKFSGKDRERVRKAVERFRELLRNARGEVFL
ncbi:MAG: molybdopterin-binding protein [Archaeoglobaceae archaeon]|nr:molybdopterin-binding protein [Archaeoglobaceae archaeon]MDW7989611.1 molybdopterin-binding protein [Archaeoglobaceae archaeon]